MYATGGGAAAWRRWAGDAAGLLVLAGLVGLLFWFRYTDSQESVPAPDTAKIPAITVYFTQPGVADASSPSPDQALIDAIRQSEYTIDMAVYELDLDPLADALVAAEQRGVRVRIVAESDDAAVGDLPALSAAGMAVVLDRRPSLMHDKFTVIDGREVWTGSMNYTFNGVYRNDNNLVRLESAEIASRFTQEFEEMFVQDRFSALSLASVDSGVMDLEGTSVEVLFSPDDHPASRIADAIGAASARIAFLAFSFTSDEIADALVARLRAGVVVQGVMEADQAAGMGSQFDALKEAGVDLRLDGSPGLLHHKVFVIDGSTVITGSYNFSRSAETTNDENVVIIHSPAVARAFEAEVDRLYSDGLP
jgi:phosphatidylserine/phosphatidylglycerophosphate/cardiolipin synthase-like enzyme